MLLHDVIKVTVKVMKIRHSKIIIKLSFREGLIRKTSELNRNVNYDVS